MCAAQVPGDCVTSGDTQGTERPEKASTREAPGGAAASHCTASVMLAWMARCVASRVAMEGSVGKRAPVLVSLEHG